MNTTLDAAPVVGTSLDGLHTAIVGINYAPEPTGIAPYTRLMAEALADAGALGPHSAAHHLGQPLADRQAQAGATILAGRRGVNLAEGLEQAIHAVGRDADASVAHRDVEQEGLRTEV